MVKITPEDTEIKNIRAGDMILWINLLIEVLEVKPIAGLIQLLVKWPVGGDVTLAFYADDTLKVLRKGGA